MATGCVSDSCVVELAALPATMGCFPTAMFRVVLLATMGYFPTANVQGVRSD